MCLHVLTFDTRLVISPILTSGPITREWLLTSVNFLMRLKSFFTEGGECTAWPRTGEPFYLIMNSQFMIDKMSPSLILCITIGIIADKFVIIAVNESVLS